MAVCALLVLRVFKGAKNKAMAAVVPGQLPAGGTSEAAGLIAAPQQASDSLALRRQISGALRKNPEHVKQVFAGWIDERQA
jgi:hypothetical protein